MSLPNPLPDNPNRWTGWKTYNSENPYERLCLAFEANPSSEQIEDHCRQLLVWWQKKLPLKSQPSNPLSQLLRGGLDDAPKFLAEARTILLDPASRRQMDERIRARLKETAATEFYKFLAFALANGVLQPADENNLYHLGSTAGLSREEMKLMVDAEVANRGAKRMEKSPATPPPPPIPIATTEAFAPLATNPHPTAPPRIAPGAASGDPRQRICADAAPYRPWIRKT